jgi:type I restriction enzyme M protein
LTFLLFLKMADQQSRPPFNKPSPIPKSVDWQSLMRLDGDELETHYRHVLESLGKDKSMFSGRANPRGAALSLTSLRVQ